MLPFLWSWDLSPVDACGLPEQPGIRSVVLQLQTEPAGFVRRCAVDEESGAEVCRDEIQYQPVDVVDEDLVDEPWYPDALIWAPPLGGVTFIDIGAEDLARNRSGGTCQ